MNKKFFTLTMSLFIIFFSIMIIICFFTTKTVPKSQVKFDMLNNMEFYNGNYFNNEKEIKSLKYLINKQYDDTEKILCLPISTKVDNEYINGNLYFELNYKKNNDKWELIDCAELDKEINIKKEIDSDTLLRMMSTEYPNYEFEQVQIKNIELNNDNLTQNITAKVYRNDGTIQYEDNLEIRMSYYNNQDIIWKISNINVINSDKTLINGVNERTIKKSLINIDFDELIEEQHGQFYLDDEKQIKTITIVRQNSYLDEKKDEVTVQLEIEVGNGNAQGTMNIQYIYDMDDGWKIENIAFAEPPVINPVNTFEYTKENLINELIGKTFYYDFNGHRWIIEDSEIRNFEIKDISYSQYGDVANVLTNITLSGGGHVIEGELIINYYYEDGQWYFDDLERNGDFNQSSVANANLSWKAIGVSKIEASSVREPIGDHVYYPEKIHDNDIGTAWVEGVSNDGVGEWIQVYFDKTEELELIEMYLGYHATNSTYYHNFRPRILSIHFSDGDQVKFEANDEIEAQYLQLTEPKETDWVKFLIEATYGNDDEKDNCISEINFYADAN